jgi:L-asparaginase II
MRSRNPIVIEVTRGPIVESIHEVVAVVADDRRIVTSFWGQLDYVVTPRSSIKFLQAYPLVESGAFDRFQLSEKQMVLACASHRGQKHHLEALREWLKLIQKEESLLRCGAEGEPASVLGHNCSGKHLGMITTALHLKMDPARYDAFEHPYQEFLRRYLTELTHIDFMKAPHGLDGCCIPTYGMSLQKLAIAMTLFVSRESSPRARHAQRMVDAIKRYPEYLGGENDLTHHLIEATHGRAILKTGAEGAYTGLMPELGFAFALKAVDGSTRAAEFAALQIFKQQGAISPEAEGKLKKWFEPEILNSRGEKVGLIRLKSS